MLCQIDFFAGRHFLLDRLLRRGHVLSGTHLAGLASGPSTPPDRWRSAVPTKIIVGSIVALTRALHGDSKRRV